MWKTIFKNNQGKSLIILTLAVAMVVITGSLGTGIFYDAKIAFGYGGGGGGGGYYGPTTVITPASSLASSLIALDNLSSSGVTVVLPSSASATVTVSGGNVTLTDNSVAVALPTGAVASNATVSITPQDNYPQPSSGYAVVGYKAYSVTAQTAAGAPVTQLANEATLTFKYTDSEIAAINESTLKVSYWSEETGEWLDLVGTVNAANNTITATAEHFTKFVIQGQSVTPPVGSLIKTANSPAVYYLGHDLKRYVFPDDKIFYTWYSNFNDVLTISNEQMVGFTLGGNVYARGGTKLVQFIAYDFFGNMIIDDPKIYVVEPGGVIRWLETAAVASSLYGSNWEQKITPVPNYLFSNYLVSGAISSATYPSGTVVKETSTNNVYYIDGTQKRLISTNGLTTNNFQAQYYAMATNLNSYTSGTALSDYQNSISWVRGK